MREEIADEENEPVNQADRGDLENVIHTKIFEEKGMVNKFWKMFVGCRPHVMKVKTRNPKSEIRNKPEIRI